MNVRVTSRAEFRRTGVGSYKRPKHFGRVDITKEVNGEEALYLRRWYLFRCKLFSIRLHHIVLEDQDCWPHDHPWNFVSLILRGGYSEVWGPQNTFFPILEKKVRRINYHKATDVHRITKFKRPTGSWTLVLTGKELRKWGFSTDSGWWPWDEALKRGLTT